MLNFKPFHDFIESLSDKEKNDTVINICMHNGPDPDAIGSALGMQFILNNLGWNSQIYYSGEISHPQNKTLVNVLDIPLSKTEENIEGINICVDGTEANSCVKTADFVIDHHKNITKAKLSIIEPSYGSCVSLIWQLFKELKIELTSEDSNVATALLLGVRTDTNDLTSENMVVEDFTAYQELLDFADKEALQKIMNYPLPRYLYDKRINLHREGNFYESNGTFVGGIGFITGAQRDAIAILSEEYTRMESVNTAVIFAITDKKNLHVSIRSSLTSLDVGALCHELFGDFGGGKAYKGGATIPLSFYGELENGEASAFWKITCKQMFKKILKESWKDGSHKEEE